MKPETNDVKICRLFVAIPVPDAYRGILSVQQYHNREKENVRWILPENLHVTVFFIGNISESMIPDIQPVVQECTKDAGPFTLQFKDIILQGSRQHPAMIWARFEKDPVFSALSLSMSKKLEPLGVAASRFPEPVPHITLARIRSGAVPEIIEAGGENIPFTCCELWRSNQTGNGVRYESLYRYCK